jgi:hypothetical protein
MSFLNIPWWQKPIWWIVIAASFVGIFLKQGRDFIIRQFKRTKNG